MRDTFGDFLKQLRLQHNMKQVQVAKHLGISRQAYSYYERNNTVPGMELLTQLSELYQIPLQTFCAYMPKEALLQETSPYGSAVRANAIYCEFLDFFSQHENMKKYHHLNRHEKELLFAFQKLSLSDQNEVLLYMYFKSSRYSSTTTLPDNRQP